MKAGERKIDFGFGIADCGMRACNPQSAIRNPQFFLAQPSTLNPRPRRGMTLIELLVVIIIITTLVAAVIPLLSPANDDRQLRKATRGLNTYITGAQSRAASSHRPFGIAIKRLSGVTGKNVAGDTLSDNGVSVEVQYAEQPAPYSGFDANSRASVALYPDQVARPGYAIVRFLTRGTTSTNMPMGWSGDLFPSGMIRPGDVVSINGTEFALLGDNFANDTYANIQIDQPTPTSQPYFKPKGNNSPPQILALPLNDSGQQIYPKYDSAGKDIANNGKALTRPYWTALSHTRFFASRLSRPMSPINCPRARLSICGHRALVRITSSTFRALTTTIRTYWCCLRPRGESREYPIAKNRSPT